MLEALEEHQTTNPHLPISNVDWHHLLRGCMVSKDLETAREIYNNLFSMLDEMEEELRGSPDQSVLSIIPNQDTLMEMIRMSSRLGNYRVFSF